MENKIREIKTAKTNVNELSVFLPTFNEEQNLGKVILHTAAVLKNLKIKWELIVVNDGSRDNTLKVAQSAAKTDNRIRIINHEINKGYGAALKSGLYAANYNWVAFTDSDGQFDFSEITKFFEKQYETNADLVIGYYKKRQVSKFKIITSRIWEYSVFLLFGLKVRDIDCGFKLISKEVINKIPQLESERGAFISSELLIKSRKSNFKIVEVPVTHFPRTKGSGTGRNLNVIIKSFVDLLKLWGKLKASFF